MLPRVFLSAASALLAATAGAQLPDGPSPNVLVFVADDLGVEQLAVYGQGSDYPNTPVIDSLAVEGVRFTHTWSYPICSPTRATLQTGRYGFRSGMGELLQFVGFGMSLEEVVIPEMLDLGNVGYAHGLFGKWHLGNDGNGADQAVNLAGWSHFEGTNHTGFNSYFDWLKNTNGSTEWTTAYLTTETADDALEWIGQQSSPWIAFVAFHAPHSPYHAPPAELHTVDLSQAQPPEDDPRPYFRAMVESMDTEMGRVMEGLGAALDNTVVIFVADNGTQDVVVIPPFQPTKAKGTLFEVGIRVPLIVKGPGVVAGGVSAALTSTVDVYATVAELARVDLSAVLPAETELDSLSLVPHLADPALASSRPFVYSERFEPNGPGAPFKFRRTAMDGRFKLIQRTTGPADALYDLSADPLEVDNLLLEPLSEEATTAFEALSTFMEDLVLPWPASVHGYGCGVNPEGSLIALEDEPTIGSTATYVIDNPLGASTAGDLGLLLVASKPASNYPCGEVAPAFGLAGSGALGERLVSLTLLSVLSGGAWAPGAPVAVTVDVPPVPELNGTPFYLQGLLLGQPHTAVPVGLTEAYKVQFGIE